ncbi:MAG: hypothetical protein LBT88_05740 [Oscillospiraceae bacterium]|nr:hypothetical protein [Oscillospiraceae bacterium]
MKKIFTLTITFALFLTLTACGSAKSGTDTQPAGQPTSEPAPGATEELPEETAEPSSIQTGSWNESRTIFTNEWSNLQITLPEGFIADSDAQLADYKFFADHYYEQWPDQAEADGIDINSIDFDTIEKSTAYDFIIRNTSSDIPDFCLLKYEDLLLKYNNALITEFTMINEIISNSNHHIEIERGTCTIAGATWAYAIASVEDINTSQHTYTFWALRNINGVMAYLILTSTDSTKDSAMSFLDLFVPIVPVQDSNISFEDETIHLGSWNESRTTFTNEWSNLQIILPEGFTAADYEAVAEEAGNNGSTSESAAQPIAYDFIIQAAMYPGTPSLMLIYQNLSANLLTSGITESGMLDMMAVQFTVMEEQGLTYAELERGTRTIAGKEWTYAIFAVNDSLMTQFYALRKINGEMANLILSYTPDTESSAMNLLDAITAAK